MPAVHRQARLPRTFAVLTVLALLTAPLAIAVPRALADADPASDMLLVQDVFYPYSPAVSNGLQGALNKAVSEAHAAGYAIKVALIETPEDLGGLPNLYGQPQRYANFLVREISFNRLLRLLVVMPAGFGVTTSGGARQLGELVIDKSAKADGLARAAIAAVERLSAAAGHPIAAPKVAPSPGKGGGVSPAVAFGAPVALVILVAIVVGATRRRREEGAETIQVPAEFSQTAGTTLAGDGGQEQRRDGD